jgi:hypothetical protein
MQERDSNIIFVILLTTSKANDSGYRPTMKERVEKLAIKDMKRKASIQEEVNVRYC